MAKKAYACLGGPLDGKHAISDDFFAPQIRIHRDQSNKSIPEYRRPVILREEVAGTGGIYGHLRDEYFQYNAGDHGGRRPSMVWIHFSLLRMPISPRSR